MICKISFANIAVTNRCNLKCRHCRIWKAEPKVDIGLDIVRGLFSSKVFSKHLDLTLTGGEPFLHKEFMGLVGFIFKNAPSSLRTISTNGTRLEQILAFLKEFRHTLPTGFSLHISLDGISGHFAQRRFSSKTVVNNIRVIKKLYPFLDIKLKFTITPYNYRDIVQTYEYAVSNNLGFKIKPVEVAKNYTNAGDGRSLRFDREMKYSIMCSLLYVERKERLAYRGDANFIRHIIQSFMGARDKVACKTPAKRVFIMPDGRVYSCLHHGCLGNLKEKSLEAIWDSRKAERIRERVLNLGCDGCLSYHGLTS